MAKIICLFNHKGGVSKTTTAFNLGWMMALKGARVVLADCDPQCNLTGMVLGFQAAEDLEAVYDQRPKPNNVREALAPAFESQPRQIAGVQCMLIPGNDKLFLLPGHIGLAEYETTLGIAQELSGSLLALRNLPGSLRFMLDATAAVMKADYVLVDMSPSLGPLNQNLLATTDHFIVPLHPDFFSLMALNSLASTLPRWITWARTARTIETLRTADYPFPEPRASFIGAVIQKYRPRNQKASSAFQRWIDQLVGGLKDTLVPAMEKAQLLDSAKFSAKIGIPPWTPIMEVPDFNGLIALSQEYQVPVYGLTETQLGQRGSVKETSELNMQAFQKAFSDTADRVFALTS